MALRKKLYTMASNSKAVTGTAVMARSANEKKKTFQTLAGFLFCVVFWVWGCLLLCGVFVSCFASVWNPEFSPQFRPR